MYARDPNIIDDANTHLKLHAEMYGKKVIADLNGARVVEFTHPLTGKKEKTLQLQHQDENGNYVQGSTVIQIDLTKKNQ